MKLYQPVVEKIDGKDTLMDHQLSMLYLKLETLKELLEFLKPLSKQSTMQSLRKELVGTVGSKLDMLNELAAKTIVELTSIVIIMQHTVPSKKQEP